MKQKRHYELDALRGLAALAVVLYHYTTWYDHLYGHDKIGYKLNFEYGYLGVQLFFVISGFVIFMTLEKCASVKEFIYKRTTRLFPAYIFAVVLTFTVVKTLGLEGREVSFFEGIINLTMLQGHLPGIRAVDGVYWSLSVELTFYAIMAIIFYKNWTKKIEIPIMIWLGISLIIKCMQLIVGDPIISYIDKFVISSYSYLFIAGITFYRLRKNNTILAHSIIFLCLLYSYLMNGVTEGVAVTLVFLLFYLLHYDKLKFLNNGVLVFFGSISYSLYLVHQNIGYIIINFLEDQGLTGEWALLIPILVSVGIATFITKFIENPIQERLRRYKKAKQNKLPPVNIKPIEKY